MKFKLEIELGNDMMRTKHHLAGVLLAVAEKIKRGRSIMPDGMGAPIFDINGNNVGKWEMSEE